MSYDRSFSINRENYIVYLLEKHERISISELCSIFNMVPSSMRKVLSAMEKKGLLIRTHGGAASLDSKHGDPLDRKSGLNTIQKKEIASAARRIIKDGETLALGDGSTIVELCYCLKDLKDALIYTDSMAAATVLMHYPNIEVRICNGIVQGKTGRIVGLDADLFFSGINVDKAFIGADAVNPEEGVGSTNLLISQVDRSMLRCAKQRIVLCDYSKLGKRVTTQVVPISRITCLITDSAAEPGIVEALKGHKVNVMIAPPIKF